MFKNPRFLSFLAALLLLAACSTITRMTATWKEPDMEPQTFQKVVVVSVADDRTTQKSVEIGLSNALSSKGLVAVPGFTVFKDGFLQSDPGREEVKKVLEAAGIDGILAVALLDVKEDQHYVPGNTNYEPVTYYNHWYSYYRTTYQRVDQPGYYETTRDVYLESNLYRELQDKVIWTAQSETYDPESVDDLVRSYSKSLVKTLETEGVVAFPGKKK